MKCDDCTCTYENCSCKLPNSYCAYENLYSLNEEERKSDISYKEELNDKCMEN